MGLILATHIDYVIKNLGVEIKIILVPRGVIFLEM